MKKFRFCEMWDGGDVSGYFDTAEEAYEAAKKHAWDNVCWTANEMAMRKKNCEDFIIIDEVELNEEGEEVDFEQTNYSVNINEKTVSRIY